VEVEVEMEMLPLKVLEVEFKKVRAGEPLEVFWGPARARVTAHIRRCELAALRSSGTRLGTVANLVQGMKSRTGKT
jgi:hypothetical protein